MYFGQLSPLKGWSANLQRAQGARRRWWSIKTAGNWPEASWTTTLTRQTFLIGDIITPQPEFTSTRFSKKYKNLVFPRWDGAIGNARPGDAMNRIYIYTVIACSAQHPMHPCSCSQPHIALVALHPAQHYNPTTTSPGMHHAWYSKSYTLWLCALLSPSWYSNGLLLSELSTKSFTALSCHNIRNFSYNPISVETPTSAPSFSFDSAAVWFVLNP